MTDPITTAQLDELERLEKAATKGEWFQVGINTLEVVADAETEPDDEATGTCRLLDGSGSIGLTQSDHDTRLVAAARNALPRLLAAARRLRAVENERDAANAELAAVRNKMLALEYPAVRAVESHFRVPRGPAQAEDDMAKLRDALRSIGHECPVIDNSDIFRCYLCDDTGKVLDRTCCFAGPVYRVCSCKAGEAWIAKQIELHRQPPAPDQRPGDASALLGGSEH